MLREGYTNGMMQVGGPRLLGTLFTEGESGHSASGNRLPISLIVKGRQ